eukprot:Awhi_evm1s4420
MYFFPTKKNNLFVDLNCNISFLQIQILSAAQRFGDEEFCNTVMNTVVLVQNKEIQLTTSEIWKIGFFNLQKVFQFCVLELGKTNLQIDNYSNQDRIYNSEKAFSTVANGLKREVDCRTLMTFHQGYFLHFNEGLDTYNLGKKQASTGDPFLQLKYLIRLGYGPFFQSLWEFQMEETNEFGVWTGLSKMFSREKNKLLFFNAGREIYSFEETEKQLAAQSSGTSPIDKKVKKRNKKDKKLRKMMTSGKAKKNDFEKITEKPNFVDNMAKLPCFDKLLLYNFAFHTCRLNFCNCLMYWDWASHQQWKKLENFRFHPNYSLLSSEEKKYYQFLRTNHQPDVSHQAFIFYSHHSQSHLDYFLLCPTQAIDWCVQGRYKEHKFFVLKHLFQNTTVLKQFQKDFGSLKQLLPKHLHLRRICNALHINLATTRGWHGDDRSYMIEKIRHIMDFRLSKC